MSLYIGKDVNGNSQLHITRNMASIATLKTVDILPDTLFNSSSLFLTVSTFMATAIVEWDNSNDKAQNPHYIADIPTACVDKILNNGNQLYYTIIVDGKQYNPVDKIFSQMLPALVMWADNHTDAWGSTIPAPSSTNVRIIGDALPSEVVIVVYNIVASTGAVIGFSTGTDIHISSTDITVGGRSLLEYQYIIDSPINSEDIVYSNPEGAVFQIINTKGLRGNFKLQSKPPSITIGDKVILTASSVYKAFTSVAHYKATVTNLADGKVELFTVKAGSKETLISIQQADDANGGFIMIDSTVDTDIIIGLIMYGVRGNSSEGAYTPFFIGISNGTVYIRAEQQRDEAPSLSAVINAHVLLT